MYVYRWVNEWSLINFCRFGEILFYEVHLVNSHTTYPFTYIQTHMHTLYKYILWARTNKQIKFRI